MEKDRVYLKSRFNKGDRPKEQDFTDLIDSAYNKKDDRNIGSGDLDAQKIIELITDVRYIGILKSALGLDGHNRPVITSVLGSGLSNTVTISHDRTDEKDFRILRSEELDGTYELIATISSTQKVYTDNTNIVADQMYYYKVESTDINDAVISISDKKEMTIGTGDSNIQIPGTIEWPWENVANMTATGEGFLTPETNGGWTKLASGCLIPENTDFELEFKLNKLGTTTGYTQFGLSNQVNLTVNIMDFGLYFVNEKVKIFDTVNGGDSSQYTAREEYVYYIKRVGGVTSFWINSTKKKDFPITGSQALSITAVLRSFGVTDLKITLM